MQALDIHASEGKGCTADTFVGCASLDLTRDDDQQLQAWSDTCCWLVTQDIKPRTSCREAVPQ